MQTPPLNLSQRRQSDTGLLRWRHWRSVVLCRWLCRAPWQWSCGGGVFHIPGIHGLQSAASREILPRGCTYFACQGYLPCCQCPRMMCRPMDDAFRAYASLQHATSSRAPGSAVLTARCGLFFGGLMAAVGQMDDAFACYTRASNFAEPVLGAMLLEQAALCQARMAPPRLRKAVQYLTLAGVRYHHQRLAGLAVVSFRGVSSHLHGRWPAVSSTVAEAGAMACKERARWRDSAAYLCAALSTPAGSDARGDAEATKQLLLQLRRVLCNARDVATDLFRDPQVLALGVPQVDDSTVPMQLRGVQVCHVVFHQMHLDASLCQNRMCAVPGPADQQWS